MLSLQLLTAGSYPIIARAGVITAGKKQNSYVEEGARGFR